MAKTTKKAVAEKAKPEANEAPFYLSKARLKGYKTLKDCSVDFKPGLNIIIGKNGAGKTNFLTLLNTSLDGNFRDESFSGIELNINGTYKYDIKVERTTIKLDGTRKLDGTWKLGNNNLNIKIFKDGQLVAPDNKDVFNEYQAQFLVHHLPVDYIFFSKPYSSTFFLDQGAGASGQNKEIKEQQSFFTKSVLARLLDWIYGPNSVSFDSDFKKLFDSILTNLNLFISEYSEVKKFRFKESLSVNVSPKNKTLHISDLQLEFLVGDDWLLFEQLSDGTKRVIYILTEIGLDWHYFFSSTINYGWSTRFKDRIILIEEPELSIHPHLLSNLMDFIREQSKTKQIIITTHSPQVLDMLNKDELDRIIIASYDTDKGTQMRRLSKAEQQKAKTYIENEAFLSDYWKHSDLEK